MKFKNILLYAALLSGMSFSSCTDFLDEDSNPNALSPGIFWKSEGDIMKGLTSVYGALQPNASWAIPFERYIVIDGYRSDEITHRDDVTSWMNISSFNVEPTNSVVKTEWTNLYKGINYANQCLTNIPTVPGDSESLNALKKQSIAEARFLRAYFYYRLYVNFGERVPIYKEALAGTDEEFYPPQANPGELVSLIETELKEVQSDLPESYEESEKGRVTRYTAAALLGKFYMFRKELSKAEVLKHLQDKERPCELALEGSRWYDLVRWGIVEETLKAHNKPFVENYVDTKHQLFPIPHSEFLLNPDWEQNPNYSK